MANFINIGKGTSWQKQIKPITPKPAAPKPPTPTFNTPSVKPSTPPPPRGQAPATLTINNPQPSGLPKPGGVKVTKAPTSLGGGRVFSGQPGQGGRGTVGGKPQVTKFPATGPPTKAPSAVAPGPATQAAPDPSTPDTSFPIPLVPADEQAKTNALADYGTTMGGLNLGLQNAAMAYGDPTLEASLGLAPSPNPNSALAMAALKAQLAGEANTARMESNNTVFSSLNQLNTQRIADAQQRAQLQGYQRYQNALANFNQKMGLAAKARDTSIDTANTDERNTAIANLPNANTATGGFKGSTNQGKKAGKPSTVAPKTKIAQPKSSSVQVPKTGKGKSAGKSKSSVKSVSPVSVKKPPKAKGA